MKSKTPFYAGMLGGGVVIAIFLIALFSFNFFNYRIHIDKITINALQSKDSVSKITNDSILDAHAIYKSLLIKDLQNDKSILTPQEYTNNIVNYYNIILLILSVMLAGFSLLSFIYIKSHSKDLIQEKLQSNEFQEEVSNKLLGRVESRFREDISTLQENITSLENRLASLLENKPAEINHEPNNTELE